MNTSVVESLKAAGLYKEEGRMAEQTLKTILPDGQITEHLMAEIDYYDLKTIGDELEILIAQENPWIQALFAKNAVAIANAVRTVNVESASGFKGAVGGGRQLDMLRFRPEQFQNPAVAAAQRRLTWARAMALVPGAGVGYMGQLICAFDALGIDGHADLLMGTTEAMCIFGFANPSWVPATSAIRIRYIARQYNVQNADFDLAQVWDHFPLIELKEPLIVYPRETVLVEAEYYQNATDEIQPVGLW
ncbi:unnamed protein product, partial [marine sediment metagenome]